jgi:nitrous oxidase accessory protein
MEFPWCSQECDTSGIDAAFKAIILLSLLASALLSCACASVIQSGPDIQTAIASARSGDTIIVGSGEHNTFEVDKPLTIKASGAAIRAGVQRPAITINADDVRISGFRIEGMGKDTTSKFNYYMQNPQAAAGQRLDLPNAAMIVNGNDAIITNTTIFGAQAGVFTDSTINISLVNNTFESCDTGAILNSCSPGKVEGCRFSGCKNYGLDIEGCSDLLLLKNSIVNTVNAGVLLKESTQCNVRDNLFSGNTEGLALWNSTFTDISGNEADHNYYGILLTESDNNTVTNNNAIENTRSEIVNGFGDGISLQANSSSNVVAKNTARKNFNGLELTKGCKLNVIYGNNATDNTHGLRMDKNYNNLIYGNNFARNQINAYENASSNAWNTTIGNYYSDYKGKDANGDGIGDKPYDLPGMDSKSSDLKPLVRPYAAAMMDVEEIRAEARQYEKHGIDEENENAIPYKVLNGAIVISANMPTAPPKWPEPSSGDDSF